MLILLITFSKLCAILSFCVSHINERYFQYYVSSYFECLACNNKEEAYKCTTYLLNENHQLCLIFVHICFRRIFEFGLETPFKMW